MAGGIALFWGAGWGRRGPDRAGACGAARWPSRMALSGAEACPRVCPDRLSLGAAGTCLDHRAADGLAAIGGQYGLTLFTMLVAALPDLPLPVGPGRAGRRPRRARCGGHRGPLWGALRLDTPGCAGRGRAAPGIRLWRIQPNAAQHLKWRPDMIPVFWERQLDFTAAPTGPAPDLIVWPETAIPTCWNVRVARLIRHRGRGGRRSARDRRHSAREGMQTFNSLAVIGAGRASDPSLRQAPPRAVRRVYPVRRVLGADRPQGARRERHLRLCGGSGPAGAGPRSAPGIGALR